MNPRRNVITRQWSLTMDSRAGSYDAWRSRAGRVVGLVRAACKRVWTDERLFFAALTLFNLFLARRTFGAGIWADNDSVCHYAYLRHLIEEILPATGSVVGFTPKYDLGAPFLLYNTPPGLYVAAAALARVTGLSALAALKAVMVAAFLAVPILGARVARTFEDEPRDLPKFVALSLSLFSSELFGLEFFFKNGMLNAAFALPSFLATLLLYRRAQRAVGPRALVGTTLAGVTFAATLLVHLFSAYMLGVALGAFAIAQGPRRIGRSMLQAGGIVSLGLALSAFWLVPSLAFAASEDVAFTWIRRAADTMSTLSRGTLFSSYPVGFDPRFVQQSDAGLVAVVCSAFALGRAVQLRRWPVLACFATAAIALLVMLGPSPSFGLSILPMYDRLLWYRFCTLFELSILLTAGWGAWQLWEMRGRLGTVVTCGLVVGALWAAQVTTKRAVHVQTTESYSGFVEDVDRISHWLVDHGNPSGRVFSEFLAQGALDAAGVNYARHMIPIQSGFAEAGGWVYENGPAAQDLLKKGLFWHNAFPIIALAPRYDVQYVVAGSPSLVRALQEDPRWQLALGTPHLSLFAAVGREPSLIEARGWDARVRSARYLRGGGYEYVIDAAPAAAPPDRELTVKTSWSPAWRARAAAQDVAVVATSDGLVQIALPDEATTVTLTWSIGEGRGRGDRISLAAVGAAAVLLFLGTRRKLVRWPDRALEWVGRAGAALGLVVLVVRARSIDPEVVGFGIRGGMDVTYDAKDLRVGAFDDAEEARPAHVKVNAWGPRTLVAGEPARALSVPDTPAAMIALSPVGPNRVVVRGVASGPDVGIELRDGAGREVCRVSARLGEAVELPAACVGDGAIEGPGVRRDLVLHAPGPLAVSAITLENDVVLVEGEQMHNALDDGGYEAFYTYGPAEEPASNGVAMVPNRTLDGPVALDRRVDLPHPSYELWLLTHTVSERLHAGRSRLLVESDGIPVADVDPRPRTPLPFWDDRLHVAWVRAGRLSGTGKRLVRVTLHDEGTMGDLDTLAFVPVDGR
jgi:hypothetical protein